MRQFLPAQNDVKIRRERGISSKGIFITVEGVEGSGKTTQLGRLRAFLTRNGYSVVMTREPGGTPLAERIRSLLLDQPGSHRGRRASEQIRPWCEAALILAARSQHVSEVIQPALRRGAVVVCDRFSDSTLAYQGYGRGLPLAALRAFNRHVTQGIVPDLTLLFDVPVPLGLARRRRQGGKVNRLDREGRRFHESVRRGFLKLAGSATSRIKVIDGRGDPDAVATRVEAVVRACLARRRVGRPSRLAGESAARRNRV